MNNPSERSSDDRIMANTTGGRLKVLFVCLGNICRSPAAEGIFQHVVQTAGLAEKFTIDSAGTASYHVGKLADARMREAAAQRGYVLTSRARMLTGRDLTEFDLIVTMDRENYRNTVGLSGGQEPRNVKMLSDYLDSTWPREVPDPYYGGDEGFQFVLSMLEAAAPKILASLVEK